MHAERIGQDGNASPPTISADHMPGPTSPPASVSPAPASLGQRASSDCDLDEAAFTNSSFPSPRTLPRPPSVRAWSQALDSLQPGSSASDVSVNLDASWQSSGSCTPSTELSSSSDSDDGDGAAAAAAPTHTLDDAHEKGLSVNVLDGLVDAVEANSPTGGAPARPLFCAMRAVTDAVLDDLTANHDAVVSAFRASVVAATHVSLFVASPRSAPAASRYGSPAAAQRRSGFGRSRSCTTSDVWSL
jgi:hypothetical protein